MEDDKLYYAHIMEAIERIERYRASKAYEEFAQDSLLQDGIVRQLEIIGEAAKHLSESFRASHTAIPWRSITGMRDTLIHEYFGVNLQEVWDTATQDIPLLKKEMTKK